MVAFAPTTPRLGRFVTIWLHDAGDWHCSGLVSRIVRTVRGTGYQLRDGRDGKLRPLIMGHWIRRTKEHPKTKHPAQAGYDGK